MKLYIKEFEAIMDKLNKQGKPYWAVNEQDCNRTLFCAYGQSKERDNELIDFNESIWPHDVEPIVSTLRSLGVGAFTFSSSTTSYVAILAAFRKLNVAIQDIVYVNNYAKNKIPAILLKIQ